MSLESVALGGFGLAVLSLGYLLAVRVDAALTVQERYAEALSWRPPSEDPEHYADTREHRRAVFQLGGVVLLAVGALLILLSVYATLFVESFPR